MRVKSLLFKFLVSLVCVPVSTFVLYKYVVIWHEYFKNAESLSAIGAASATLSLLGLFSGILLGIYFLVKYNKTGRVLFLALGLALTLVVPGLFWFWTVPLYRLLFPASRVMCYMPVVLSAKGLLNRDSKNYRDYRKKILPSYRSSLPGRVVAKIASKENL